MAHHTDKAPQSGDDPSATAWYGRVVAGRYRLAREIGRGGMGAVYEAVERDTGAPCAVKVLLPEFACDGEALARFRAEADTLRDLDHPHVVRLLDSGGFDDGEPFLVFELLRGETLATRLHAVGALPLLEGLRIAEEMAAALALAHARGVVHRDVKPENVFLHRTAGGRTEVRLIDFGIAKSAREVKLTAKGAVFGSLRYMAPEQLMDSGAVNASADIYSLGAVLYEMLTGAPPFDGTSFSELSGQIVYCEPPPPSERGSPVPLWLERNVLAALAKDPGRRPATALDVISVHASRELAPERGFRRTPRPALLAAAALGAFLAGVLMLAVRIEYDAEAQFGRRLASRVALAQSR
jgi:serine/threonine protein kinase